MLHETGQGVTAQPAYAKYTVQHALFAELEKYLLKLKKHKIML
jgi:hypothetical protein